VNEFDFASFVDALQGLLRFEEHLEALAF